MSTSAKNLCVTWFVGGIVGTLIIAFSSPLFLRSYVALRFDPIRQIWTLSQTPSYRWRSEGYADTLVGPLGMPGRPELPAANDATVRVALWGDSQTEGCAVWDDQKIFAQTELIANRDAPRLCVLPLARSSEDATDWVAQMPFVDARLNTIVHVFMIAELIDLAPAGQPKLAPPNNDPDSPKIKFRIANYLPAFAIQAARNLLTSGEELKLRKLRFTLGRVSNDKEPVRSATVSKTDWQLPIRSIAGATNRPIVLIYAPVLPAIVGDRVVSTDAEAIEFERMKQVAQDHGITVVDLRDELLDSARRGQWPHGFHNGRFGSGHLNVTGNQIVARGIVRGIEQAIRTSAEGSD